MTATTLTMVLSLLTFLINGYLFFRIAVERSWWWLIGSSVCWVLAILTVVVMVVL